MRKNSTTTVFLLARTASTSQFQALIKELRTGAINVMVTKDFSRCHRNYTQMGNYLECAFPFLGVRYISVNDGYDSDDYKGVTSGMDVVLRNIIYEAYRSL